METTSTPHRWVPVIGALAGAAFAVKYAMMLAAGNDAPDSAYAVLYLTGLGLGIIAGVGLGLRRRVLWQKIVVGLAAPVLLVAWIMGLGEVLEPVAKQLGQTTDEAVEFPIGVAGLVMLAASYAGYRHDHEEHPVGEYVA